MKKQKESKDPFMYLYAVNKQKKLMLGIEESDNNENEKLMDFNNMEDQIKFYNSSYVKNDVVGKE